MDIAILNPRGRVGNTLIVAHLFHYLAAHGVRCAARDACLLDDPRRLLERHWRVPDRPVCVFESFLCGLDVVARDRHAIRDSVTAGRIGRG